MDAIVSLYTHSDGRIARKTWWLGVLGLIVLSLIISIILGVFGLGLNMGLPAFDPSNADMAAVAEASAAAMRAGAWGSLINFAILAYPAYNLMVKRRHDRNNSGRDVAIYMAVAALLLIVQALGLGMSMVDFGGGIMMPMPSAPLSLALGALGIFGLYLLVVCGFLRGTAGSNSYGADPLDGAAATI
ncbi:hypothetical protein VW29_19020 [Devosia limi DSM 17137]|uniref:Uncharacterized membrane protein YhaH, DUF805 family n=1 Tax=Devosia limi DSM 17137 TaxID=1121477 RepID=A0A0F5L4B1_9HYPH|nr:DUF805 domain-containing protein [Devosia limi]KKB77050.1 hypothetical protein VW29_19020 [Devosia limi DSM 17137]SHF42044.1 Uncharacterized membrane protein YhaH, DUF805 family [Devosia limi DSM 17137]